MTEKKHSIRFTQNFIHSPVLAKKLVRFAAIHPGETVLEIGPGKGILTRELAERVTATGSVVAVEYDKKLAHNLAADFEASPQIKIEYGDILKFDLRRLSGNFLVFSNIPFNITSEILEHLFTGAHRPDRAYLVLQTDTLIGKQIQGGGPTETFKSLMIKPLVSIQPVYAFSMSDFKPRPHVNTTLFGFARRDKPLIAVSQVNHYKDFLAFIAKDRVGEGVWKKIFSKRQLANLVKQTGLVNGKGLKLQSVEAIASLFARFVTFDPSKQAVVRGAMARLRAEQRKTEQINLRGDHRRPKR
jgi:23S rRNA (adenine-N6)-dimethyltransferase